LFPYLRIGGNRLQDWAVLNTISDYQSLMALKHHPAVVYNGPEDACWVRTVGRQLLDTAKDRSLAAEVAQLMDEYRQAYDWQAVSVENICIPEIGQPFSMIQAGFEHNPCGQESMTYVNPAILDDNANGGIFSVLGACGSLANPFFLILRQRHITLEAVPLNDYLKGSNTPTQICSYGDYYPSLYEHETDHIKGICLSDIGPIAHLYLPHGRFQPPREKGHFPSEFDSFIHKIVLDAASGQRDSPLTFLLEGTSVRYKWYPPLAGFAEQDAPAELHLLLDFEQGKPYYQLHMAGCRKIPAKLDYGAPFRFILPNYPSVAEILREDYAEYQKTNPPEPFFRPELKVCDCMDI
jgi:hypothetical protein